MSADHWIPSKLKKDGEDIFVHWMDVQQKSFAEPFFDETLSKCLSHFNNSKGFKSLSSLDGLINYSASVESVPPTAFIFHVSRCGSTLFSQLMAQEEKFISVSEVPVFDEILRSDLSMGQKDLQQKEQALKAAIHFVGQQRTGSESHYFIKTDSWHIKYYKQYRNLYPITPFVFLYRSPDEVLRSNMKHPGMQSVQGVVQPAVYGFGDEVYQLSRDLYTAKVLETYFKELIEIITTDKNCLFLNYANGMPVLMQQFFDFLKIVPTPDHQHLIAQRLAKHSKYPDQVFVEEAIQGTSPDFLQPAMELYQQLNALRAGKNKVS